VASVEFDQAWEHAVEKGFREGRQRRRNERFDQARERNERLQRVVADLPSDAGMSRREKRREQWVRNENESMAALAEKLRNEKTEETKPRRKPVRRRTVSSPPRQEQPPEPKFQGSTFEPMSSLHNAFEALGVTGEEPMSQEEASAILGGEVPYNLTGERIPPRPAPSPMKDERARPMPTSGPSLQERMNRFFRDYQATPSPTDVSTEKVEQMIDMADGVNDPTNDEMGSAKTKQRVDATDFTAMPEPTTDEEPSSFMSLPEPDEEPLSDEAGEAGWKAIEESIRPPEPTPEPTPETTPEPTPELKPASKVPAVQEAVAPMKEEPKSEPKKDDSGFYDSPEGESPKAMRVRVGDKFVEGIRAFNLVRAGTHEWGPKDRDGRATLREVGGRNKAPPKKEAAPKKATPKKAAPQAEEKSPTDDLPKSKKSPKEAKTVAADIGKPADEKPAKEKKSGNPATGAVAAALQGKANPPKKDNNAEKKTDENKTSLKVPVKDSPLGHNLAKKGYPLNKALSIKDLLAMGLVNDSGLFLTNREGRPAAGTAISSDHVGMMTVAPQSVKTGDLRGMIGVPMNLSPLIEMSKNRQGPRRFPMTGGYSAGFRYLGQGKEPFPPLTANIGDEVFTGTGFSGDEFPIKDLEASAKRQGLGRYRKGAKRVVSPKIPSLLDGMGIPKLRSFDAPRFIREGTNSDTLNPQEALLAEINGEMMPVARAGQGDAVWELPFMDGKGKFMVNANLLDSFGATGQTVSVANEMGEPTGTRHRIPVMMPPEFTDLGGPSIETSIKELMERLKNAPKDKSDIAFEEAPDSIYDQEYLKIIPNLKDFKDNPAILDLMQTPKGGAAPLQLRVETTEHGEPEGDFEGLMNELRYLLAPRIPVDDEEPEPFVI